jgi:hypothetical protein
MTNKRNESKQRKLSRTQAGQGLLEGVCALMLIVPTAVALVMFFINIYAIMTIDTKLTFIANEAVKWRTDNIYWLGMERQNVDKEQADRKAQALAVAIANASGIPVNSKDVVLEPITLTSDGEPIMGEKCTITVTSFRLPFGGGAIFPLSIPRKVTAVSASAPVPPPAIALLDTHHTPFGSDAQQMQSKSDAGILIPSYGGSWKTDSFSQAVPIPDLPNVPVPNPSFNSTGKIPLMAVMEAGAMRSRTY